MAAWLSEAGDRLRSQIDRAYPGRDKASEGWIGSGGDHAPDPQTGVVRAVDIDSSFGGKPGYNTTKAAWQVANDLRKAMIAGDQRVAYIIAWNPEKDADYICSMNSAYEPLGEWRPYLLASHVNHIHVSLTPAGDNRDRPFDLPSLKPSVPARLLERKDTATRRTKRLWRKLRPLQRRYKASRRDLRRIKSNIAEHKEN